MKPADAPKAIDAVLTPSAVSQTAGEGISTITATASRALPQLDDSLILSHRLSAVPPHGAITQEMQAAISGLDSAVLDLLATNLLVGK